MRLIHTRSFELKEFFGDRIPKQYAILSHTWEDDEVTFQDWQQLDIAKKKAGFFKIEMACQQARKHGIEYVWVDTNCIDKTSSAELSEAINSMFSWYRNATICYAYLLDVEPVPKGMDTLTKGYTQHFSRSRWFTRGWTLQELLAPVELTFYARDWSKIASRPTLSDAISIITRIETAYLTADKSLAQASVAQKMSWLSRRVTTRVEDMAYSMLGIFDINMPLLYGEGAKAFIRLQEEIIRVSNDQTIFCWTWTGSVPRNWVSLLAPCPQVFEDSGNYSRTLSSLGGVRNYAMTNTGLSITLPVVQSWSYYFGLLNAHNPEYSQNQDGFHASVPVRGYLDNTEREANFVMERIPFPPNPVFIYAPWILCQPALFIRSTPDIGMLRPQDNNGMVSRSFKCGFLLMFDNTDDLLDDRLKNSTTVRSAFKALGVDREGSVNISPGALLKGAVYLTERTKDLIGIKTFPPNLFDPIQSFIHVEPSKESLCASVLVKLGQGNKYVVFLGLRFCSGHREPYRFCRVIINMAWTTGNLLSVQQQLEVQMCRHKESRPYGSGGIPKVFVMMNEEVRTNLGLIYPTYVTSNRDRIGWMGTVEDDSKDVEISSHVAGVTARRLNNWEFNDDIKYLYH